ncbi:hypothetical protein BGZ76_010414 [Entomortierella beljakovae]|nr:hypothetical protein BGZ76_010414 [Entomortierella beljakovae]
MVIFGGSDQNSPASNIVHRFDLVNEVWVLNVPVGSGTGGTMPSARRGHTSVCLNNTMILYGGGPDGASDDDVWELNASNGGWVWNRISTNKQMGPGPRTGHTALLNGTNMLVWGGYGTAIPNDINIYILDLLTWQWSSSKDVAAPAPLPFTPPGVEPESKSSNLPLIIGVVGGSIVLIAAFVGLLLFRRKKSRTIRMSPGKDTHATAGFLADIEENPIQDEANGNMPGNKLVIMEEKSAKGDYDKGSTSSSSEAVSQKSAYRRSPQEYPIPPLPPLILEEKGNAESSRSSDRNPQAILIKEKEKELDKQRDYISMVDSMGSKLDSVGSDPFYPTYLAEDDEEDADRWTFASSLSFDRRDNPQSLPTLRYIPGRVHGAHGTQRSLNQSTGSIGGDNSQRVMMMHSHGGSQPGRRTSSGISVRTRNESSLGPGSVKLATGTSADILNRDNTSPRDATIFTSVSPLDRVTLLCSGLDVGQPSENSSVQLNQQSNSGPVVLHKHDLTGKDNDNVLDKNEPTGLRRKDTTSTSTTNSSTTYTTLENPALISLVQNMPARYKLSKLPSPIHGDTNDILFAIDSDTQQPIVIKSFARKEAWERECRVLKRLRGPCVVDMKHVATLLLSETDDTNKPQKIRLAILERLDETLAQMLKNARKAKKVSLREQAQSSESLDLGGAGLYRYGPALDESYIKDIVKGVLRCLTWCHTKKIVYCDLKPSNIMHNRDDPRQQWKFIDMESSRVASEECIGIGTVRYCPPEVAKGTTVESQASSGVAANYSIDFWAFGCLIYELYATRPLFPLNLSDDTVLHFLAHPSPSTPTLANGLRWNAANELDIPNFEEAVPDSEARALIRMLLHPDPKRRANIHNILDSEYLRISPELQRSYTTTSSSSDIQQIVSTETKVVIPSQPLAGLAVDSFFKVNPCLVIPLPDISVESSLAASYPSSTRWIDPSRWSSSSFKLHYLCQHFEASSPYFGHYVHHPGYPIQNPPLLFANAGAILIRSLDLFISKDMSYPPGYEFLTSFRYDSEKDQVSFAPSPPSPSSDENLNGDLKDYCRWIKRRIIDSASSPPPYNMDVNHDSREIIRSLDHLRIFSETAKPSLLASSLHLIHKKDDNGNQAEIWICEDHLQLPAYRDWTR